MLVLRVKPLSEPYCLTKSRGKKIAREHSKKKKLISGHWLAQCYAKWTRAEGAAGSFSTVKLGNW